MKSEIDTVIQRTQRYWYVDGLGEMAVGLMLAIFGLYFSLLPLFENQNLGLVVALGQPVLLLLLWWLGGKAVRALKERITYPRTGYVLVARKKKPLSRLALAAITAMVVGALVGLIQAFAAGSRLIIPTVVGAFLAFSVAIIGRRFGLARFYVLAAYTFGIGLLTGILSLTETQQNTFLFAMFGLGWIISGAVTFARYLASTRPPSGDFP